MVLKHVLLTLGRLDDLGGSDQPFNPPFGIILAVLVRIIEPVPMPVPALVGKDSRSKGHSGSVVTEGGDRRASDKEGPLEIVQVDLITGKGYMLLLCRSGPTEFDRVGGQGR